MARKAFQSPTSSRSGDALTSESSLPDGWAGALLQGYSHGLATSPARTGFCSMYRAAANKYFSSRGKEANRPCQRWPRHPSRKFTRVLGFRDGNHMDVVWHQTVRPDRHLTIPTPLPHQGNVRLIVLGTEERLLPAIPPLRNMVGDSRRHHPRNSRHIGSLFLSVLQDQEFSMVSLEFRIVTCISYRVEGAVPRYHRRRLVGRALVRRHRRSHPLPVTLLMFGGLGLRPGVDLDHARCELIFLSSSATEATVPAPYASTITQTSAPASASEPAAGPGPTNSANGELSVHIGAGVHFKVGVLAEVHAHRVTIRQIVPDLGPRRFEPHLERCADHGLEHVRE